MREEICQMEKCIETLTMQVKEHDKVEERIEEKWREKVRMVEEENRQRGRRIEEKDIAINILNMKVNEYQSNLSKEKEISAINSKEL